MRGDGYDQLYTVVHMYPVWCVFLCRQYLFDAPPVDPNYERMPEDRPGGFNWGEGDPAE